MKDRREKEIELAKKKKMDRDMKKQEEEKQARKTLYENRQRKKQPETTKATQFHQITIQDLEEEKRRHDTPRK